MKYKNKQAKRTHTSGIWISVIGFLATGISTILFIAIFGSDNLIVSALIPFATTGFIGGIMTIGFGSGLKCIAQILETNYRRYKNIKL